MKYPELNWMANELRIAAHLGLGSRPKMAEEKAAEHRRAFPAALDAFTRERLRVLGELSERIEALERKPR